MQKLLIVAVFFIMTTITVASENTFGLKITTPQTASISFGRIYSLKKDSERMIMLQAEPGVNGGKIKMGYGFFHYHAHPLATGGSAVKLSLLKTWNNPSHLEKNQTYLGLEVESIWVISFHFGVYKHIHGNDKDHDKIISFGIGLGY